MAALAQGLPVLFVPEQPLIPAMRHDMVNNGGRGQLAILQTDAAQRIPLQIHLPRGLPFPVVAAEGSTAAQSIRGELRRMLRAVHLPRLAEARTARLPAGTKGCMRHGITSQNNQAAVVVDGIAAVQVLHGPVKAHDQRHNTVNLLGGLLLIEHADNSIMHKINKDFRDDKTPRKSLFVGLSPYLRPYSPVSKTPL